MKVKCPFCKRKYSSQELADKCHKFHSVPFKYEEQTFVSALGVFGFIDIPTKKHFDEHWHLYPTATAPEITGSNCYLFSPIVGIVGTKGTKYINECDIKKVIKTAEQVNAMYDKTIVIDRAMHEKYGKAEKWLCSTDKKGNQTITRQYTDKTITITEKGFKIKK